MTSLNYEELMILRTLVNKQWMSKELQALDAKLAMMREEARIEAPSGEPAAPVKAIGEQAQEIGRLLAWKEEALQVMSGLQDLGRELGVGLGESITSASAAHKARKMRKALENIANPGNRHSERARLAAEEALR
jgi:hypothetical protein